MSLLEQSTRLIDESVYEGPRSVQPMDGSFNEIADGIAVVCAFSHVWSVATDEGLVAIDTSLPMFAPGVLKHLHKWRSQPVHTIVYTHGHADHVGGAPAFVEDARERGRPVPRVVAHEAVGPRFDRYNLTHGYNQTINRRQFSANDMLDLFADDWVYPDTTYAADLYLEVGGVSLELIHAPGRDRRPHHGVDARERGRCLWATCSSGSSPTPAIPRKVQRYPSEWAAALRRMIELRPALLLPAHGLPIAGEERIAMVLDDVATALEGLVADTLEMMNAGARLDDIIHQVRVPDNLMAKPYLRAAYDEPEFVVRNIWRLYGGWYDGNPARLKPAPDQAIAAEVARLAGGAAAVAARAVELSQGGNLRLACHLAEWAAQAAPDDSDVLEMRADVYRQRRDQEQSLMSRGIYNDASQS